VCCSVLYCVAVCCSVSHICTRFVFSCVQSGHKWHYCNIGNVMYVCELCRQLCRDICASCVASCNFGNEIYVCELCRQLCRDICASCVASCNFGNEIYVCELCRQLCRDIHSFVVGITATLAMRNMCTSLWQCVICAHYDTLAMKYYGYIFLVL